MLKKITIHDVPMLAEIFQEHIIRSKADKRTDVTYASSAVVIALQAGNGCLWVDDLENPTCYIYGTVNRRSIFNELAGLVEAIYISDNCKHKVKRIVEMVKAAETFFKYHKCTVSHLSSWVYEGSPDVVKIWNRLGYKTQEIVTTKHL